MENIWGGNFNRHWDGWSRTTSNHIRNIYKKLKGYWFGLSKADWESMDVVDDKATIMFWY